MNWNHENLRDTIIGLVVLGILITLVVTVVRFLWPLILVAIAYLAWKIHKAKKQAEEAEQQEINELEKNMFYEQVRRKVNSGDIIDAEFTESDPSEKGNQQ